MVDCYRGNGPFEGEEGEIGAILSSGFSVILICIGMLYIRTNGEI